MVSAKDISAELALIFNKARLEERTVSELIGFCRGAIADGVVQQAEAEFLEQWLAQNQYIWESPVMQILLRRVSEMLSDGVLDPDESAELLEIMKQLVGGGYEGGEAPKATSLPLDRPMPEMVIPDSQICFTGTFAYGTRRECEDAISALGGIPASLTKKTKYLVIGSYATESWKHSSYGTKIEKACELRNQGSGIVIVSEEHWLRYIQ